MRICSLVPGATDVIVALGLADQLVGVSHECDVSSSLRRVPVMIEPLVRETSSTDIDRQVTALATAGQPLYRLNEQALLDAQPDVILTQDLCHVCAITPGQLTGTLRSLPSEPRVVSFTPTTLEHVLTGIEEIARALDRAEAGQALVRSLRERLAAVRTATAGLGRPRVACLEWLDPLYTAGHWVPDMVAAAGGCEVLAAAGSPSRRISWKEVEAAQPDVVLLMPCGYTVERTMEELIRTGHTAEIWGRALTHWPRPFVVDAAAYFSRPSPRLIDGVELLAAILHPGSGRVVAPAAALKLDAAALAGHRS